MNSQPDACLVAANQITVIATLTVTGSRPLVLVGQTVDVGALIDVSSHLGGTVGPASPSSLCATFPTTPTDSTNGCTGGAAGASFMTVGGGGGKGGGTASGVAAPAADVTTPAILRAGCKGELGGTGASAAGAFGAGGGAIYIAANSLTLSGVIDASGAGAHGGGFSSGGSGAGSGGMIVLWATALNATGGKLLANGGSLVHRASVRVASASTATIRRLPRRRRPRRVAPQATQPVMAATALRVRRQRRLVALATRWATRTVVAAVAAVVLAISSRTSCSVARASLRPRRSFRSSDREPNRFELKRSRGSESRGGTRTYEIGATFSPVVRTSNTWRPSCDPGLVVDAERACSASSVFVGRC